MLSSQLHTSLILAIAMVCTAVGAVVARPSPVARGANLAFQLEQSVPLTFGSWKVVPQPSLQLVNPQTQELLDTLYSQLLTRVYVNDAGYRIMLSMAYGDDQRGGLRAHMPEVCYPAQGFKLHSREKADVSTAFGSIPARRVNTSMGTRVEPITYWFNFGSQVLASDNPWEKRMIEFRLRLSGKVPNGILVRVSSIDSDTRGAYRQHERFAEDFIAALAPIDRVRIAGLPGLSLVSDPVPGLRPVQ
jgi:EpsI family protein